MIPHVIHYCWFGRGPKPELAIKCIDSWKKMFPGYKIIEWNEDNFNVNMIPYTAEAYRLKKYAFVSDYARFWILYNYGGLYFDTDVEVINNFDDIVSKGAFMGCELWENNNKELIPSIAAGLGLGAEKGNSFYKKILDIYKTKHFATPKGAISDTVVTIITKLIKQEKPDIDLNKITTFENITIYPFDYFCPIVANTGKTFFTERTHSIHHYMATWKNKKPYSKYQKLTTRLKYIFNQIYVALFIKTVEK